MARKKKAGAVAEGSTVRSNNPVLKDETAFKFLQLPPEIRNMIYMYLVVVPTPIDMVKEPQRKGSYITPDVPLLLRSDRKYDDAVICTAILTVCRQIHYESASILYSENRFYFLISEHHNVGFREDLGTLRPRKAFLTGKVMFSGRIYYHVFRRMTRILVEIRNRRPQIFSSAPDGIPPRVAARDKNIEEFALAVSGQERPLRELQIYVTSDITREWALWERTGATFPWLPLNLLDVYHRRLLAPLHKMDLPERLDFVGALSLETAIWVGDVIEGICDPEDIGRGLSDQT